MLVTQAQATPRVPDYAVTAMHSMMEFSGTLLEECESYAPGTQRCRYQEVKERAMQTLQGL